MAKCSPQQPAHPVGLRYPRLGRYTVSYRSTHRPHSTGDMAPTTRHRFSVEGRRLCRPTDPRSCLVEQADTAAGCQRIAAWPCPASDPLTEGRRSPRIILAAVVVSCESTARPSRGTNRRQLRLTSLAARSFLQPRQDIQAISLIKPAYSTRHTLRRALASRHASRCAADESTGPCRGVPGLWPPRPYPNALLNR